MCAEGYFRYNQVRERSPPVVSRGAGSVKERSHKRQMVSQPLPGCSGCSEVLTGRPQALWPLEQFTWRETGKGPLGPLEQCAWRETGAGHFECFFFFFFKTLKGQLKLTKHKCNSLGHPNQGEGRMGVGLGLEPFGGTVSASSL